MSPGRQAESKALRRMARVGGVVQGVGFRPFVFNLARSLDLGGYVANTAQGVELAVQGAAQSVDEFFRRLRKEPPPLAHITDLECRDIPAEPDEQGFSIRGSTAGRKSALISPDVAVCADCLAEMQDPNDRRYRYPFINCTNCGPRYTIIKDLPYDRPQTTMAAFTMCGQCRAEYEDPANRRFHAQPNACPVCGPRLWLADAHGREMPCGDPAAEAARALRQGRVVAIKGLGGFHLAADAFNEEAVSLLRSRKHREEKPLALMVPDVRAARKLVELDRRSEKALTSRQRPIVLAPMRRGAGVAPSVNPANRLLGLMLPYTPLHYLLMAEGFKALVMTSGNVSDEPICLGNQEAIGRIGGKARTGPVADLFLLHDRDIYLRGDDSVVRVVDGRLRQMRRSRGYAPEPLALDRKLIPKDCPPVLAVGAHLKNTLCLLRGNQAFVSQHVGDLENLETLEFFELTAGHLSRIFEAKPGLIACDLHPDYLSTGWALKQGAPVIKVQHHHAHAAAVMAEHGLQGPVLALCLDGTGFGPDGTVWGGELLRAGLGSYERLGRLKRFSLPGGEAAVREPWRIGLAMLVQLFGDSAPELGLDLVRGYGGRLGLIAKMIEAGLNTPACSSLGRLFDAAAALAGLRYSAAYEGQAAVELEQAMAGPANGAGYCFEVRHAAGGLMILDWSRAMRELVQDALGGADVGRISARFHQGLALGLAQWAGWAVRSTGLRQVCLGGGCLMNAFLLTRLPALLAERGLEAYTPARAPAGDGGISLGQAACAAARWGEGLTA